MFITHLGKGIEKFVGIFLVKKKKQLVEDYPIKVAIGFFIANFHIKRFNYILKK